jgi:xylulokinase
MHLFAHPIDWSASYMGLICFKNGSLVRERLRDEYCQGQWEMYENLVETTEITRNQLYFSFANTEITPTVQGDFIYGADGVTRKESVDGRAAVKMHLDTWVLFLFHRLCSVFPTIPFSRIIVVGGGSRSKSILQTISDVFSLPVMRLANGGEVSASLGAAYRAKFIHSGRAGYAEYRKMFRSDDDAGMEVVVNPRPQQVAIYKDMKSLFARALGSLSHL